MRPRLLTLAAAAALTACAGGPPKPPALAYALPTLTQATYVSGDSAAIDIDAGGQLIQMDRNVSYTLGTTFSRAPDGIQVSAEVKALSATQTNPMGAPITADGKGISQPVVFNLDRRGVATMVSQPELDGTVANFFQPLAVAQTFFPRLPGRAANPGETWTDTIRFESKQSDADVSATQIMTYTVVGDTIDGGRSVLKIAMEGTAESVTSGAMAGMEYTQKISGKVTGWVLWDPQRVLMTEMWGDTDATGTMDVSLAPYPLSLRIKGMSRVRLADER